MSPTAPDSRAACIVERELYRYWTPTDQRLDEPATGITPPRASHDAALTAFAQIGALRLSAKRCFIVLIAPGVEHIVAEAGQSMSLIDEFRHDENDGLSHGVGEVRTTRSVASPLMAILETRPDPTNDYVAINDLVSTEELKGLDIVNAPWNAKAVVAFPMTTPKKIIIGLYCVIHDQVQQQPITDVHVQFLKDMASTVIDHLEVNRSKTHGMRAALMVKAQGAFVEGASSIRHWFVQGEVERRKNLATKADQGGTVENHAGYLFGTQNGSTSLMHMAVRSEANSMDMFSNRPLQTPDSNVTDDPLGSYLATNSTTSETTKPTVIFDPRLERGSGSLDTASSIAIEPSDREQKTHSHIDAFEKQSQSPLGMDSGRSLQEAVLSSQVRDVFARAANLIREAMLLDGAIFFDASVSSFSGTTTERGVEKAPGRFAVHDGETSSSIEEDMHKSGKADVDTTSNGNGNDPKTPVEKPCNILGFSTRHQSTVNGHAPPAALDALSETFLRGLLKKYPHGKVYNFTTDGTLFNSESDGISDHTAGSSATAKSSSGRRVPRKGSSRTTEAANLSKILPGIRSAIFYPLWDPGRERWFAGGLFWSTWAHRVLCPLNDIVFVASFGNSIMAEVSRVSALASSQMKSDFVSAISHELRSPLHGILGCIELIQDTTLDDGQADMISTIHSCGKTLLDTIDHVLEFSKVNQRQKSSRRKRRVRRRKVAPEIKPTDSTDASAKDDEDLEDLAVLSEEVIESVCAGISFGKRLHITAAGGKMSRHDASKHMESVVVILDIDHRADWRFQIDGGAIRRILLNVFGNATKYTQSGFIRLALRSEEHVIRKDGKTKQSTISLTVTDSGKGMSQEFLNTHLFTPFVQEDSLAIGSGLGLSIVNQIVHDLGGTIHFTSEKDVGTEARIVIPCRAAATVRNGNNQISTRPKDLQMKWSGMTASMVGFDKYPDIIDTPDGILSASSRARILQKSAISDMLAAWLGLTISSTQKLNFDASTLYVVSEDAASDEFWHSIEIYKNRKDIVDNETKVVVILCLAKRRHSVVVSLPHLRVLYMWQPYGPHRFAAAVYHAVFRPVALDVAADTNAATAAILPHRSYPQCRTDTQDRSSLSHEDKGTSASSPTVSNPSPLTSLTTAIPNSAFSGDVIQQSPLRVLLVEDNAINLKLLVTYMKKLAHSHTTANDGLEALRAYKAAAPIASSCFDVVITDISMPVMDGFTSSREIRQHEHEHGFKSCTIIAMTGAASIEARQEAFQAGIDLFLTKPVPLKTLGTILEGVRTGGRDYLKDV